MGPSQVLPLQVRIDLRVMAMKGYSILLRPPEMEPHNQMQFSVILRTSKYYFYLSLKNTIRIF